MVHEARPPHMNRRTLLKATGAATAGAALPLAVRRAAAQESSGKSAVIQFQGKPYTHWTGIRFWTWSGVPGRMLFEPLLDLTPELLPDEGLVETWEIVSPTVSRYQLREGITWSDGTPITVDDVIFSFDLTFHPDSADQTASELATILGGPEYTAGEADSVVGVRAVDDRSFEIETSVPDTTVLRTLALRWWAPLPKHIYENVTPADLLASEELLQPPVVSGPFQIDRIEPDKWYEMSANASYWRGAPKLDSLTFIIGNIGDVVALAEQEEIDFYVARQADVAAALAQNPNYDVTTVEYIQPYRMQLNCAKPQFQDPRVRRAFAYAIDRDTLTQQIYGGAAAPQLSDFLGDLLSPDAEVYGYDPDLARQLLAEAGWDPEQVVMFERTAVPAGQTPDPIAEAEFAAYQVWLGEVGIKLEQRLHPDTATYADFIRPAQASPEFDLYENPHRRYDMYGPLEMKVYLAAEPSNYAYWVNTEADDLVQQAVAAATNDEVIEIGQQLSVIVADECPYIPTKALQWGIVAHKNFSGYTPVGEAYFAHMRPYDWDIAG